MPTLRQRVLDTEDTVVKKKNSLQSRREAEMNWEFTSNFYRTIWFEQELTQVGKTRELL